VIYLAHASLLTPFEIIPEGALLLEEPAGDRPGRILAAGPAVEVPCPAGAAVVEAAGYSIAPGFIDLQINGAFGCDFTDQPPTIWEVAAKLPRFGVTSFLPTIITSPVDTIREAQRVLQSGPPPGFAGAAPQGLHLEGPFLNPAKNGAHPARDMRLPDVDLAAEWRPATGVRLVTLAPELPGALEVVRLLRSQGVTVSAGHSLATFAEAQAGFRAGITLGTHLFNAMPPLNHRSPGLVGALLASPEVGVGLIADGLHVHPALVALAWKAKAPGALLLVTDAMAALGEPPGSYQLGDKRVLVDGDSARLPDGTLAGSLLAMEAALRNLVAYSGCSLLEAVRCATATPAKAAGLAEVGQLRPGAAADLVLLTGAGEVAATLVGGRLVYSTLEPQRFAALLQSGKG
jgi:N-acetylglucosamine-6-phosphate deacetylase